MREQTRTEEEETHTLLMSVPAARSRTSSVTSRLARISGCCVKIHFRRSRQLGGRNQLRLVKNVFLRYHFRAVLSDLSSVTSNMATLIVMEMKL